MTRRLSAALEIEVNFGWHVTVDQNQLYAAKKLSWICQLKLHFRLAKLGIFAKLSWLVSQQGVNYIIFFWAAKNKLGNFEVDKFKRNKVFPQYVKIRNSNTCIKLLKNQSLVQIIISWKMWYPQAAFDKHVLIKMLLNKETTKHV